MGVFQTQAIIGLGNPGEQYHHTRHNVGFRVLEALVTRFSPVEFTSSASGWFQRIFKRLFFFRKYPALWEALRGGDVCRGLIGDREILFFRPSSFMNRSGEAVASFLRERKLDPTEILILVDDIDLPLGHFRLKASGGPGTHNGLRDVCKLVGKEFPRLRFGIRGTGSWDNLADYVLSDFSTDEEAFLAVRIQEACRIIALAVEDGLAAAMNVANRKMT